MALVVHDDLSLTVTVAPQAYVGVPLSVVLCIVASVFLFRDKIVTGVGEAAGQTVRLSWWTARRLKKVLEAKPKPQAWNAWHCLHCERKSTFKAVGVYCVRQKNGVISYYLEGICTRTNKKGAHFIDKGDLATAGVPIDLEPRPAKEKVERKTWISPNIHKKSKTSKFGGTMVTGYGISPDVAKKMEEEWNTMADFANAKKSELKEWREANGVHPSVNSLWTAATEMKKHLEEQARPNASPARS